MSQPLIQFKEGVNIDDVHPHLMFFLGIIAALHVQWTGRPLVVTSLRRPPADNYSRHQDAQAVDIRRHHFQGNDATFFCRHIQSLFGSELGVVLEPEWIASSTAAPHIHIQSKSTPLFYHLGGKHDPDLTVP